MALFGNKMQGKGTAIAGQPRHAARRPDLGTIIVFAMFLVGAGIIAYPTFADWWNNAQQVKAISSYTKAVEQADTGTVERLLWNAHEYNRQLASKLNRYEMTDEEYAEYKATLDLDGTGIMGYIQAKSLGIDYPIYHGIDEKILQRAVGHMEGSSLPVGGATTHAVITGHRGLPSAKLFSNLDRMREGDTFTITVLTETLTYEVDQIRIVEPIDIANLEIEEGKDYVTLVTCTPYGVNTHRLLVRGHRVENIHGAREIPAEAVQIPNYLAVPAVGVPMLFIYLAANLLLGNSDPRKGRADRAKALEELRGGDAHGDDRE